MLECTYICPYRAIRSIVDGEQLGPIDHRMEQSLRQKVGEIDKLHSPHVTLQVVLPKAVLCRYGPFHDADFAQDLTSSKSACCVFEGLVYLFQHLGNARGNQRFCTAVQKPNLHRWTQDCAWRGWVLRHLCSFAVLLFSSCFCYCFAAPASLLLLRSCFA